MLDKLRQYLRYRSVFASHQDIQRFRSLRDHPAGTEPIPLHVRQALAPLWCRPGTMDAITLWDAFYTGYHLPSVPLVAPAWIVDLGANAGYTAAHLAHRFPRAGILAVEMDAANADLCRRNLAAYGSRCTVVHAAIWSENGTVAYGGSNVHNLAIGAAAMRAAPAITVETLLDNHHIDRVAYLKMDIEGAERAVVCEHAPWLARVEQIGMEVHPPGVYGDMAGILERAGFFCHPHPRHPWGLCAHRAITRT